MFYASNNLGIQINTVIESSIYESRLELLDVTLNTPTLFQCSSSVKNKTVSKRISFQIKGNYTLLHSNKS